MHTCQNYTNLLRKQVKLFLLPNIILALIVVLFIPIVFGIKNLDAIASSMILERFLSLIGIILLVPIFAPEKNSDILEVLQTRSISIMFIYIMRVLIALLTILFLYAVFILIMYKNNCQFPFKEFFIGSVITAVTLGGFGFMIYAIANNIICGYLASFIYYITNYFSKAQLKSLYLFSLADNSFAEKQILFFFGLGTLLLGLAVPYIKEHLR